MYQSEVSEIIKGRRVIVYQVLVRIADGLGIPRELMGLGGASRQDDTYAGDGMVTEPVKEADDDVKRVAPLLLPSFG